MNAAARKRGAALKRWFGLSRLRPGQARVIDRVLAGRSTLAVMPTGAGKSLCYQLPAVLLEGRTVVVSPLIALMKDQCEYLQSIGIAAVQVNSAVDTQERHAAEAAVQDGSARVIMATPEQLADADFLAMLGRHPVSLLAVDEAHCVSQWGHDFRPAFLEVGQAWEKLGRPVVLGLTATAPADVAKDVCEVLRIPEDGVIDTSSYRPNLDLRVEPLAREQDKLERVVQLVRKSEGSGIVYAATVKAAQAVQEALVAAGEPAGLYHGKLGAGARHDEQDAFMEGRRRVMVATNAFGLGIDKPDIRFVIHYQLPPRVESYYQEAGRAGRDGQPATCTLLFLRGDKAVQQFFMAGRYPAEDDALAIHAALGEPPPEGSGWTFAQLKERLPIARAKLQVALGIMRRHGLVEQDEAGDLRLRGSRQTQPGLLRELMAGYEARRLQDREALEHMVFYAQTGRCRWRVLLEQLDGEDQDSPQRCGHCDNCARIAAHERMIEHLATTEAANDEPASGPARVWQRGDIVKVHRYGRGIVEEGGATQVTVKFADGSRRSFLPDFVSPAKVPRTPRPVPAVSEPASMPRTATG